VERRGLDVLLCSVSTPVNCERAVKRNRSSVALVAIRGPPFTLHVTEVQLIVLYVIIFLCLFYIA
jgi:hypothetical protein